MKIFLLVSSLLVSSFVFPPILEAQTKEAAELPKRAEKRGWLGVGLESIEKSDWNQYGVDFPAVRIRKVFRNSPAEKAGIKVGDLILKVASNDIRKGVKEMVAYVQSHPQDTSVSFTLKRKEKEIQILVVLTAYPNQKTLLESEWKGRPLPDLALERLDDETSILLHETAGSPMILDYWATWCAPCRKAAPRLEQIYEEYKAKGLRVYGISTEERKVLEVYERNNPSTYPLLVDEEGRFPKALGASKLPTFVLVDSENKVQRIVTGVNGLDGIEESLKSLFD
jgi:thiol-disulfide isomerase/thioredoxin